MKFVKVTALAAAMMATFGAQAELAAMDDAALEAVTGQTGITIVQTVSDIDLGWSDGDGVSGAVTQGNLLIQDLSLGGTMTVDISGTLGLVIGMTSQDIQATVGLTSGVLTVGAAVPAAGDVSFALTSAQTLGELTVHMGATTMQITAH